MLHNITLVISEELNHLPCVFFIIDGILEDTTDKVVGTDNGSVGEVGL
jgi:hypothetical protein